MSPVVLLWPCNLSVRVGQALPPVRTPASDTAQCTEQPLHFISLNAGGAASTVGNQLTAVDAIGASVAQQPRFTLMWCSASARQ
jgi:hypothetical protein